MKQASRFILVTSLAFSFASIQAQESGLSLGGPDAKGQTLYLPSEQRTKNVGGSDGSGLCVFTSIGHAARYQNVDSLKEFQAWMRKRPGGGYPEKVDQMINLFCKEQGIPKPNYLQIESKDPALIKAAIISGRMPSVTYDGRCLHYRQHIEHMVNVVGYTDEYVVVLDNNFIGEDQFVYLAPSEFISRWIGMGGPNRQGWVVILLDPGRAPVGGVR